MITDGGVSLSVNVLYNHGKTYVSVYFVKLCWTSLFEHMSVCMLKYYNRREYWKVHVTLHILI